MFFFSNDIENNEQGAYPRLSQISAWISDHTARQRFKEELQKQTM